MNRDETANWMNEMVQKIVNYTELTEDAVLKLEMSIFLALAKLAYKLEKAERLLRLKTTEPEVEKLREFALWNGWEVKREINMSLKK